jgi:hypothetical protein
VIVRIVALLVLLAPGTVWACATCVSSAYGDRTFNWAFLGLLLMPFAVGFVIATVFAVWHYAPSWRSSSSRRVLAGAAQLAPHEES